MSTLFSMKKSFLSILCALMLVLSFNLIPAVAADIFEVESFQRITGPGDTFLASELFGNAVANIGDLDDDGITDLAVGAPLDGDGGWRKGSVRILFMNDDGTVDSFQKISETEGNFSGVLNYGDMFGYSIASIGDFDGDGITELAVGAAGANRGLIFILFMNDDGTVKSFQKITQGVGGFTGVLFNADSFGVSVANIGDLNNDGITDIAVGAEQAKNLCGFGNAHWGAVWILFMNADGTVDSHQKITWEEGGLNTVFESNVYFGSGIANMGDLDGDGVTDLAVGARKDRDGESCTYNVWGRGAVWILFMNTDGTVKDFKKISYKQGNFGGLPISCNTGKGNYRFGSSVANIGDLDGDGNTDLAVGAQVDYGPHTYDPYWKHYYKRGAVYILLLNADSTVKSFEKLPAAGSSLAGALAGSGQAAQFGSSVASMGDLDGSGSTDLAVGARWTKSGLNGVYILFSKGPPPPVHFLGYKIKKVEPKFEKREVTLTDQFVSGKFIVYKPDRLFTPADKAILPEQADFAKVEGLETHLKRYKLKHAKDGPKKIKVRDILVTNQFGEFVVEAHGPYYLLAPTTEALLGEPEPGLPTEEVNHFLCYKLKKVKVREDVSIADQFATADYEVKHGKWLCNPVEKQVEGEVTPIQNPDLHLMCFDIKGGEKKNVEVNTNNQFGAESLTVYKPKELCVPSTKIAPVPPEPEDKCKGIALIELGYSGDLPVEVEVKKFGTFALAEAHDTILLEAEEGKKLPADIKLKIGGEEVAKFHTSCSKPIEIGDVSGPFEIVDLDKLF